MIRIRKYRDFRFKISNQLQKTVNKKREGNHFMTNKKENEKYEEALSDLRNANKTKDREKITSCFFKVSSSFEKELSPEETEACFILKNQASELFNSI